MNNKKIVVMHLRSSQQISTVPFGGELVVLNICHFLNKDKFQPVIVALKDKRAKGELPLIKEAKKYGLGTETIYLRHAFDLSAISKLKDLLTRYKVDILHCHEYKSDFFGFLATRKNKKIKVISTIHGYTAGDIKLKFYEYFDRLILRYFDRVIAVSDSIRNLLIRKKKYSIKTLVIPNAIDCEKFQVEVNKSTVKKELNIDERALVIGTVGRLSPEKGHYYFLKATKEVIKIFPNAIFLIVGDGPSREKLKKFVLKTEIKNNVVFTGFREDVNKMLSIIDVFVLPSLTEGMPIAIFEAMAASKAIIATKVGGIPSIITNENNGILVESQDDSALAKAIIKLLEDENSRRQLGEKAKSFIRNKFSVNKMAKDYENVYLEIVDK